jgi:hypothetical protein
VERSKIVEITANTIFAGDVTFPRFGKASEELDRLPVLVHLAVFPNQKPT